MNEGESGWSVGDWVFVQNGEFAGSIGIVEEGVVFLERGLPVRLVGEPFPRAFVSDDLQPLHHKLVRVTLTQAEE